MKTFQRKVKNDVKTKTKTTTQNIQTNKSKTKKNSISNKKNTIVLPFVQTNPLNFINLLK